MTFINLYTKSDLLNYYYSEQFNEGSSTYIMAAGQTTGKALITRTDVNGVVQWENSYSINGEAGPLIIKKIIQITGAGEVLYVAYITAAKSGKHYLMSIKSSGSSTWVKEVPTGFGNNGILQIEPSKDDFGFYMLLSGNQATPTYVPAVAKINNLGTVTGFARLTSSYQLMLTATESISGSIILAGTNFKDTLGTGIIIRLGNDLKTCTSYLINTPPAQIHDIKAHPNGRYLISGRHARDGQLFVTMISGVQSSVPMKIINKTVNAESSLCLINNNFLVVQSLDGNGLIHQFDASLNSVWSKSIVLSASNKNGISQVNRLSNRLTFNCYDPSLGSFIANTDDTFNTCKTSILPAISLSSTTCSVISATVVPQATSIALADRTVGSGPVSSTVQEFCPETVGLPVNDTTMIQSPNFLLLTAGSTGADGSAKGVHLRWMMMGALGAKHLPKGNYATTTHNFNKPNDFVKIYRAPYQKAIFTLDFHVAPNVVDDSNFVWVYNFGGRLINIKFKNQAQYSTVRATINPLTDSLGFITAYGAELIEVESANTLFFAAKPMVINTTAASSLKVETLAVSKNLLTAPKYTNSRKTYTGVTELSDVQLICENGRSVRYQAASCVVSQIDFEFYSDLLSYINENGGWDLLGSYALNQNDTQVFQQLEPVSGLVHNKWPRFNEGGNVNINNYKHKWNGALTGANDRNIKTVVSKFIQLSNAADNPSGVESIFLGADGEVPQTEEDLMDVSLLEILNVGANDYHIARMLGLGTLDVNSEVFSGEYIYVSEYTTFGDLEDGLGAREVQHLSISLPTSINDQRLPLPVNIDHVAPGIVNEPDSAQASNLTDPEGYTFDGRYRYVTLIAKDDPEDLPNRPFYLNSLEFNRKDISYPVYAGLEYRKNSETSWVKPELSNDTSYVNAVPAGQVAHFETVPLVVSPDTRVIYVHKQRDSGTHYYGSYGINIFSRTTNSADIVSIVTNLQPANLLKPPVNVAAHLIRKEEPLLLTSQQDQNRYNLLASAQDKTLVRLTYDYHSQHELSTYKVEGIYDTMTIAQLESDLSVYPDDREVYADEIEVFFRNSVPQNVQGKALLVTDHPTDNTLAVINTTSYALTSVGQTLIPNLPSPTHLNYVGGTLIIGEDQFIIQAITPSSTNPVITVYKKEISNTLVTGTASLVDTDQLQSPVIPPDGLFMVVENMQNVPTWGSYNPHTLKVQVGDPSWGIKREVFQLTNSEGATERFIEKSRGFWKDVTIDIQTEPIGEDANGNIIEGHTGMYKITFNGFLLPQHAQYNSNGVSVEWYNGIVRLKTIAASAFNGERTTFQVVRSENTGSSHVVYFIDPEFSADPSYDPVKLGTQTINYYPGYKVYLYADASETLTAANILPAEGEGVKYSVFGLRSHDFTYPSYYSRISTPALMFAQELSEPLAPQLPEGADYATRPDFFGKATYTFITEFLHKPNSVVIYRGNDESFLNALYEKNTIEEIRENLEMLGGNDEEYIKERWQNFLDFPQLKLDNVYKIYPPASHSPGGYALPVPDKELLIKGINKYILWYNDYYNDNIVQITSITSFNQVVIENALPQGDDLTILDFASQAVLNSFVPQTEYPIVYQHVKPNVLNPGDYNPMPKKQNIKDRNGHMLLPTNPDFDMAPMAKIVNTNPHTLLFTDFTLDGTSKNIYFYTVREMDNQMKLGAFSPFLGPIKMVNTNPPESPEIKRIMPVLGNSILGTPPSIQFEINAYHKAQFVRKITIYRANTLIDAQSIRTMVKVKEIDLEQEGILEDAVWLFYDSFDDLDQVPYGDSLYYRVTVSRKVEYNEEGTGVITEYAPSKPSKIAATLIVESSNPDSPVLKYVSEPITAQGQLKEVTLYWPKTVYNGKYHIYKMNAQGNWVKIKELVSNAETVYLALNQTDLASNILETLNSDGGVQYHHFKVISENSAGMLSNQENILSIYKADDWEDIGGIGTMIVGNTFFAR